MKRITSIIVKYHNQKVGTLSITPDNTQCVFQYDRNWVAEGFSISPLQLPLDNNLNIAPLTPFDGNFGIFEDSLPDNYGRHLINKLLRPKGLSFKALTPIERLSIIGRAGMGALCYEPETFIGESKSLPELDTMQQIAFDAFRDNASIEDVDILYFNSGNSGGCRPKCMLRDEQGVWIVKFRDIDDPADIAQNEYLYNRYAELSGIRLPLYRLIESKKGKYFASLRFDLTPTGERIHIASAGALLNTSIRNFGTDYSNLLNLTGYLTQSSEEVEQMFRLMVFNVLCDNKDDHVKNFSFMYHTNHWTLAPAYDLTPCPDGYLGEHPISVCGKGNPDIADLITAGENIRIPRTKCKTIIEEIKDTCTPILAQRFR